MACGDWCTQCSSNIVTGDGDLCEVCLSRGGRLWGLLTCVWQLVIAQY